MSPEIFEKWEHIICDVDKTKIPIEFVKKLVLKLNGRKRRTINIKTMFGQGLDPSEIEEIISRKLEEHDEELIGIEFIMDVQEIAETVQPTTDHILRNL